MKPANIYLILTLTFYSFKQCSNSWVTNKTIIVRWYRVESGVNIWGRLTGCQENNSRGFKYNKINIHILSVPEDLQVSTDENHALYYTESCISFIQLPEGTVFYERAQRAFLSQWTVYFGVESSK